MIDLLARRATGLLALFNQAGVLSAADVHIAGRLGTLTGETDEQVLLAAALIVRGTRHGSVVLDLGSIADTVSTDLDDDPDTSQHRPDVDLTWPDPAGWTAAVAASPMTATAPGSVPLLIDGSRLWLERYWRQEATVAAELLTRSTDRPDDLNLDTLRADLTDLFTTDPGQRHAAAVAVLSRISVIAGGPGTGKTSTLARLITLLWRQIPGLRIALAAPTGKAAARLTDAVHSAGTPLTEADQERLRSVHALTVHRLLGRRPDSASRFRHDASNRLPFDVVIVDESSMVSLTMMARLVEALAPHTRLILVGDPDQLASVEAGAVLGDLVDATDIGSVTSGFAQTLGRVLDDVDATRVASAGATLRESVCLLRTVHRYDDGGPIHELAERIRRGHGPDALELLRSSPGVLEFDEIADDEPVIGAVLPAIRADVVAHERLVIEAAEAGDHTGALDALDGHRLLCAHRSGPRGVTPWSAQVEQWLAADELIAPRADGRYPGQPLLATANDYETGLFNGDTGVVVAHGDDDALAAVFRVGGEPVTFALVRLGNVRPLHAMTVHRSQGSQFAAVTVLLPAAGSPLATRQTLYTAVTRASGRVHLIGSEAAVLACVHRPAARATGLRDRLS